MQTITILLAHERSGSHFLGEFLGKLEGVSMIDEVGNPNAVIPEKHPESVLGFKARMFQTRPEIVTRPSNKVMFEFMDEYFAHLGDLRAPANIVIDIKYSHVHLFNAFWSPPFLRPLLFQHAEKNGFRVLHLNRSNVVEAAVSAQVAEVRKKWHSWQGEDSQKETSSHELDIPEIIKAARLLEIQKRWFTTNFIGNCQTLDVIYEDLSKHLFTGGELDQKICTFVGGTGLPKTPPRHQKVTPPLTEVVANYDELAEACHKAKLSTYLNVASPA